MNKAQKCLDSYYKKQNEVIKNFRGKNSPPLQKNSLSPRKNSPSPQKKSKSSLRISLSPPKKVR